MIELTEQQIAIIDKLKADAEAAFEKDRAALQQQHTQTLMNQVYGVLAALRMIHGVGDNYRLSDDLKSLIEATENNK
ncbi:hypothetical protein [Paludibaculum fermentans]|uniref:hypothetical protein n=1 Tax=Paludibaculum fermentans TaxID=1473598 RepID=UPI003EB86D40